MDISKLPRLSNTDAPPPPPQPADPGSTGPTAPRPVEQLAVAPQQPQSIGGGGGGAEVWLSAILGLVFVMLGRNFATYLVSRMVGSVYHTGVSWTAGPLEGQEVAYPDLQGFVMLNDAAMFLFGLTLLVEAAVIAVVGTSFKFQRPLVAFALALAVAATAFNLYVTIRLFGANVMPIFSLLAVAFGGYIAFYLRTVLRQMPAARAVPH